ncbi:MAG: hypothetical protein P8Z00_16150 [Anaerolineales bacterium]|jgi:hypothetical protein
MKIRRLFPLLLILILLVLPASALAQTYSFSLDKEVVNVFWNEDGTASIDYVFNFSNDNFASPIDFVDVGTPNSDFDINSVSADVNGNSISDISKSEYQGNGSGFAVGLGQYAIRPGTSGRVHVFIGTVRRVLHPDTQDSNYASAVFAPTYFGSEFVHGTTDLTVSFHLPPGVKPDEPRWHASPDTFPSQPATSLDQQGRVTYTWTNNTAYGSEGYQFGASFPSSYVPAAAIVQPSLWERLGISPEAVMTTLFCGGFVLFIIFIGWVSAASTRKRKLQYLPPKISIEGHGIKRGLTAIEAGILLEQPLDKVMTMILFAVIKKGAAEVTKRDPLELSVTDPQPPNMRPYEQQFLAAFGENNKNKRRNMLQDMTIDLVKSVQQKMKGFSRRETIAYYKDIMNKAWAQVEAADTPEVKSETYDKVMEWTMLDKDYDRRTREVFRTGPVFVPIWWGRYDPSFGGGSAAPASMPGGGGGVSLPNLPGADFAASMVNGVQNFSSNVIGNVTEFTSRVTNTTNPVPVSTSSGGRSGGGGCACACACAGCACACAGGGR